MECNIAIIIPAAGFSKRMGAFKPLLPVGPEPAILRCVGVAAEAGVSEIIVVTGHQSQKIEDVLSKSSKNARVVRNDNYQNGMFSSVCAGVAALPGGIDGFFMLPADCCAVSAATLTALMKEFSASDKMSVISPVFSDGLRGHPPLIPSRFIDDLCSYNGDNGLKGFLQSLPNVVMETPDSGILMDMDTPEDYKKLLAYLGMTVQPETPG